MDLGAVAKWPNVPACYEWLSLDMRGDWRLQGERVTHRGLIDFMNRQYGSDDSGRWFVQNGPQRVYVDLACTPWIFRRHAGEWVAHTGLPAGKPSAVLIDETGRILIDTPLGIGLVDDRELAELIAECRQANGTAVNEVAFESLMLGNPAEVFWQSVALQAVRAVDLPERFKFNPRPRP
ncbi:MAG: DUF2946 family protein [Azonexus sp.]|nr:DUF2946 family protein [Azonexus sp.]